MNWRSQYEGLQLNTLRWLSAAPGMRLPRRYGRWVTSADYVSYLEHYAAHHALDIALNAEATKVTFRDGTWHVASNHGVLAASSLVIATGWCHTPVVPNWPGVLEFKGTLKHASEYHSPAAFAGRKVLIVGCGNTGTEVAQQLAAGAAKTVWISVRTPPNLIPKEFLRVPLHPVSLLARPFPPAVLDLPTRLMQRYIFDDLAPYGLPRAPLGVHAANLRGTYPVIDSGFSRAVRNGRILPTANVVGFDQDAALLSDGTRILSDDVIAATGYRRNLEELLGHLGVLEPSGTPRALAPDEASRLYFVGFTPKLGGLLFDIGIEARRVSRAIAAATQRRRPG